MKKINILRFGVITSMMILILGVGGVWAADCPIKIGGLAPLSAPGAVTGGEAMRDAMNIAVEEINAQGGLLGCPVQLIMADTEGLPEKGTAVMEKLISQDRVVAVGGGYHSSVGIAAEQVAQEKGIPVVFAETWSDVITSSKLPEAFRIAPLNSEVSAFASKFAATIPGVKYVVIVAENTDFGIPAAQEAEKGLSEVGIKSETLSVDIGTQDFAAIVQRVKAMKPDMIMVFLTGEASYNFTEQAAGAGIGPQDLPMICDQVALESKAYWTNVPDGNYAFIMRVGIPPQLYNEVAKSFVTKYIARTGKKAAESYAFEAYDSIGVLAQAIRDAGSTDPAAITKALENVKYVGALGTITFPVNSTNPPEKAGKADKWWHQFPEPAITMVQYQKVGEPSTEAVVVYPNLYKTGDPVYVHGK
jgi:branched-chain amino acid transport system substrate-binding protein